MENFKNLHELSIYFNSEGKCIEYLEGKRWGAGVGCVRCGSLNPYILKHRGKKAFKCKECSYMFNVLTGTALENTKISLVKWMKAIYLLFAHKKGISSCQLARDIGVTQKTAWFMLGRIRELAIEKGYLELEGEIESDETFIGGSVSNKHKSVRAKINRRSYQRNEKTVVLGMVERGGLVVTKIVKNTFHVEILPVLTKYIKQGSVVHTDENQAYKTLKNLGYSHLYVSHSQHEYVKNGTHVNTIEGYWSLLKRGIIGIYHKTTPKHLQRYCDEFAFRYNSRKISDAERFEMAVGKLEDTRLKYNRLIGKA